MEYFNDINTFNEKMKRLEKIIFISKFFKNKKLILTTLEEEAHAGKLLLKSILRYNHAKKYVKLTNVISQNLEILKYKIAKEWEIENEIKNVLQIITLEKMHQNSPMEFFRKGNVVIMDKENKIEQIDVETLKKTFQSIKKIKEIFGLKITESQN